MITRYDIGREVRYHRLAKRMSIRDVANELGMGISTVSRFETGAGVEYGSAYKIVNLIWPEGLQYIPTRYPRKSRRLPL